MPFLLQAKCLACGYEVELFAGFGFVGIDFEPSVCRDCREIVSVPVVDRFAGLDPLRDLNHCPSCDLQHHYSPFPCGFALRVRGNEGTDEHHEGTDVRPAGHSTSSVTVG